MKDSKDKHIEDLIAGMLSETLTEEEVKEYNLHCESFEDFNEIKQRYESLINTMREIPSEKTSDQLIERIIQTSNASIEKKPIISIANLFKLMLLFFSGFFVFNVNSNNIKYAIKPNDPNNINDSIVLSQNKNIFLLEPNKNSPYQSKYINASVVIRPDQATNILSVNGLPQLPSGFTYRLWAHTKLGLQGCVSFFPDEEGNVKMRVPSEPTKSAIAVMITIDRILPGFGPEEPGEIVLSST